MNETSAIMTTRTMPFGHYGYAAYRIEMDLTNPHAPLQRHIWTHDDGRIEAEGWIRSSGHMTAAELERQGWKAVGA